MTRVQISANALYQRQLRAKRRAKATTWYVYALVDPRDEAVRYVGQTYMPRARLDTHMSEARTGVSTPEKREWLNSLAGLNLRPRLVILEETTKELVLDRERAWIQEMVQKGCSLVNKLKT